MEKPWIDGGCKVKVRNWGQMTNWPTSKDPLTYQAIVMGTFARSAQSWQKNSNNYRPGSIVKQGDNILDSVCSSIFPTYRPCSHLLATEPLHLWERWLMDRQSCTTNSVICPLCLSHEANEMSEFFPYLGFMLTFVQSKRLSSKILFWRDTLDHHSRLK